MDPTPAGAWLLDNFFVVHEQVREIRATLPPDYYHELPKLASPHHPHDLGNDKYPRVYDIAIELIAHTDGRLDAQNVELMVREYQSVSLLTIGELWAVPAMLRMAFVENIRRMALRTARVVADRADADRWAARLLDGSGQELADTLRGLVYDLPALSPAFLTRLLQQIRSRRSDFTPLLWFEQMVAEDLLTVEEAAQRCAQELALTQFVMANSIASLRAVGSIDWTDFVEGASAMEAALRRDPAGVYPCMTRRTRDRYRKVVEQLARATRLAEPDVAAAAVDMARTSVGERDGPQAHVGFYLVDAGRQALEHSLGYRRELGVRIHRWAMAHATGVYFGALAASAAVVLWLLLLPLSGASIAGALIAALLAVVPATDVAVALVNQVVMLAAPPVRLARMDYDDGVPELQRTVVVVPIILASVESVTEALESLEVQYLANTDRQVRFALLSDCIDASRETNEDDEPIVAAALSGIRALNERHGPANTPSATGTPFYLFHRARRWNPVENTWMGWERKRGKLAEFNAFLAGESDANFAIAEGDLPWLLGVRYVITLDADTVLPRGAAAELIGTMAHPLNRPELDADAGRVRRGYGILQPRVSVTLESAGSSRFAHIYSGHPGVDPYTTAVSDVYQDLFGEGTFTGKGIYDVEAFRLATAGRFPENALLSHDLIEGAFARAGLVTDVELFDDYPSSYLAARRRMHRWIRGDWQLLPWLGRHVPSRQGPEPNPLSALSRWKIVDNLRRSVSPIMMLAWLIAGWTVLPGSAGDWTLAALAAMAVIWTAAIAAAALRPPRRQSWRPYYAALRQDAASAVMQFVLSVVLLPDQAFLAVDAIVRTLVRIGHTRRHLLEWQTASYVEQATGRARAAVWRALWPSALTGLAVFAIATIALAAGAEAAVASAIAGIGLLWAAAPETIYALGAPVLRGRLALSPRDRIDARRLARAHWHFFDSFVTADTHWLVPDNLQETPTPVIALRTSPTNIGLQLLATMSAHDLGFITRTELLDRLEHALDTMDRLPRIHGHFLNWYDLNDLRVLDPPYVSTVDSGNLAGHLMALAAGCVSLIDGALDDDRVWSALEAELGSSLRREMRDDNDRESSLAARLDEYERARWALPRPETDIDEAPAGSSWPHQRLDAVAAELTSLALPHDTEVTVALRALSADSPAVAALVGRLDGLANRARTIAMEMDFRLLYERRRSLLSIGYNVRTDSLDPGAYDLLASESRLASFIAVAKGDVGTEHWFHLSRALTTVDGETALVSWSGSMFEYLMPQLVMPLRPMSLLDQTAHAAVRRQIEYGRARGCPWGISESAYNYRDRHGTYQYRAFGVPDLALKRGLANDMVVAPYASALALAVDPRASLRNLDDLERLGALGTFGFYDSLDYTRPDPDRPLALVRTYMAHHVGMSLVALDNALDVEGGEGCWQRRFMTDPAVRAAALLLDERIPRRYVPQPPQTAELDGPPPTAALDEQAMVYQVDTAATPEPRIALLGGPAYTVLVTNAGGGYSRAHGIDVLRWRPDATRDDTGHWIYLKDLSNERVWSVAHQPTGARADSYHVAFAIDRVEFARRDGELDTHTDVVVVPSEQAEIRRVVVVNRGTAARDVELTSYGEVVLTDAPADRAHPAFQKLFITTEWASSCQAVLAMRRPRSASERRPWCVHVVAAGEDRIGQVTCETDRAQFIGRGRTTRAPRALDHDGALSGTVGAVLDPIVALRVRVRLAPGRAATVAFTTAVAPDRETALRLADRYRDLGAAERALNLASTATLEELRDFDMSAATAAKCQELAGALIYPRAAFRMPAPPNEDRPGQAGLWSQGISGDWPIVLATIRDEAGLPSVRQLLSAHKYWRIKGVRADLVLLNAKGHSYVEHLHDQLTAATMASSEGGMLEQPGGVFVRRGDILSADDTALLQSCARVQIICDGIGLGEILAAPLAAEPKPASRLVPALVVADSASAPPTVAQQHTSVPVNGYGALADNGDFVTLVAGSAVPPAPWANVIANPAAGFCVTERGGGFTWVENSYFFRLTPWFNDLVSDPCGEVLYLEDRIRGERWTPTPGPAPARGEPASAAEYVVKHAPGLSTFLYDRAGIATELSLAVPPSDPVKITRLRVSNLTDTERRITLTSYVEWSLGPQREHSQHQVVTHHDELSGALFARNYFAPDFNTRIAFSWISEPVASHTSRRDEFIGRNGDLVNPAAFERDQLSGAAGATYDPCAAMRCDLALAAGETRDVIVLLGAAPSEDEARGLIERYGPVADASAAIQASCDAWNTRLSVITARTPDPRFDAMLNRWTLYQALACRMWARSAMYQSSGAYGFRDQLQDCMAFVYAEPGVARAHLLRAAGRQFLQGDVQHWWHEPSGRGVRTRFSDDLVWLPFVADHFVRVTGDRGVWDASAPFLDMRELAPGEHEIYDHPSTSTESASLYEHCVRAVDRACTVGAHGLPLMGTGDWNDGMNLVGAEGRGESVWLAWFLTITLRRVAEHARSRGDSAVADRFLRRAGAYASAVEGHAWDGAWYLRAYYDDGSTLGSSRDAECQIDAIAQSWSVLSGAADPVRARAAMQSVNDRLVRDDVGLVLLLTPPFERGEHDPGYIEGYLPGVRENGAQYTHAALWTALAFAKLGDGDRAHALLTMLNPLTHSETRAEAERYKVEPYVIAADVYSAEGHVGRGGWTWYTGSASWSYRVALEGILGFTKCGDRLTFDPCIPKSWPEFTVDYRYGSTAYHIVVKNPDGVCRGVVAVEVDGAGVPEGAVGLVDDGRGHTVVVTLGSQG